MSSIKFIYTLVFFISILNSGPLPAKRKLGILGKLAPEFRKMLWYSPVGKPTVPYKLSDQDGKIIYLHFFQSWCPGCLSHGLPTIKALSEKYKDNKSVEFYAIQTVFEGLQVNSKQKVLSIKNRFKLNIPMAHDDGSLEGAKKSMSMYDYKSGGTPWAVIISPSREVVYNDFHITVAKASEIIDNFLNQSKKKK
ncbi:MAG: TlpA family protein disulfide reductase [Bacteriovoracaceae bacterium]|nr:TlpA family protein disulfide reductase [Bacteriovoracaceae bacterium]